MELEQKEAQICRLCGKYESIYIDVFGEEGRKRLLGLKIYTKINIVVKENDGLSQKICVRCIGTLEFWCDFYERCHQTQKELLDTTEKEEEEEADKENADPVNSSSRNKKDLRHTSPNSTNATKGTLTASNNSKQTERSDAEQRNGDQGTKELHNLFYKTDRLPVTTVQPMFQTVNSIKEVDKKPTIVKRPVGRPRKYPLVSNGLAKKSTCDPKASGSGADENRIHRRRRYRKSSTELLKEAAQSMNYGGVKRERSEEEKPSSRKRHYLRPICSPTNGRSDTDVLPSRRRDHPATRPESTSGNVDQGGATDAEVERVASARSKPVSVIVKQEKTEEGSPSPRPKANAFVWIPNEMLTLEADRPKIHEEEMTNTTSPPPGDEAEKSKLNESSVPDGLAETGEQNRVTVIKLLQSNEVVEDEVSRETIEKVSEIGVKDGSEDSEDSIEISTAKHESSRESSFSGSKTFGRISDLISEEQKEKIETFYRVDMSVVDPVEVQKQLTIVDRKSIRCNICGVIYPRMDKCQVHIWGHLRMKPYQCKACNFTTLTVSNVRCHIRKSHLKIKPFACHLCEKRFVTAILLEEHVNTHTGARPFKCKICGFGSASRQMLSYHAASHKPAKDVDCKICGKQFYSRSRLRAHMLIHNKDKVVVCKLCSAYLSSPAALEMHHQNVHMRDYVCNQCGKRVKSRKALHNHQNVHAAAKYKCTLCPNVYKSSQILKEHLLKHEGIRKYKCNNCGKSFAQQSHLAAHMAVHSEIRFHCPGCDKAFNRHDNMKIHTKRCKPFLANPELQSQLVKRERSRSSMIAKPDPEDTKPLIASSSVSYEQQPKDVPEKTDTSLCQLGLNISCIEPVGGARRVWNCDILEDSRGDVATMPDPDDKAVDESGETIILENVLAPENF